MMHQLRPGSSEYVCHGYSDRMPGTYALLIGVSRYKYLNSDKRDVEFEKLKSCALTAYAFYQWLSDEYFYKESKLVKCWLLLSPSDREYEIAPELHELGAPEATYSACKRALKQFKAELSKLREDDPQSRSVFLFSGHGIEQTGKHQMLLPYDYYRDDDGLNEALGSQNIQLGLQSLPVVRHFLFFDACRNSVKSLRKFEGVAPTNILGVKADIVPRNSTSAVFAAPRGGSAWSPKDPRQGISYFGQALLDGLRRGDRKNDLPDLTTDPGTVWMSRLLDYLPDRLQQLLKGAGVTLTDPIEQEGVAGKIPFCNIRLRPKGTQAAAEPLGGSAPEEDLEKSSDATLPVISEAAPDDGRGPEPKADYSDLRIVRDDLPFMRGIPGLRDVRFVSRWNTETASFHKLRIRGKSAASYFLETPNEDQQSRDIGSEYVTSMLRSIEATSPDGAEVHVRKIEAAPGEQAFRVTLNVTARRGSAWVQLQAENGVFAFVAPITGDGVDYVIEFSRKGRRNTNLLDFVVSFACSDDVALCLIAQAWRSTRNLDFEKFFSRVFGTSFAAKDVVNLIRGAKRQYHDVVADLLIASLFTAGHRELADAIVTGSESTDSIVFAIERERGKSLDKLHHEAAVLTDRLPIDGLPRLSLSCEMLVNQFGLFDQADDIPVRTQAIFRSLARRYQTPLQTKMSSGMVAAYCVPLEELDALKALVAGADLAMVREIPERLLETTSKLEAGA